VRKFKFEQINSTPYKGLDGTVIFGDGTETNHKILIEAVNGLGVPQSIVQTQQAPFQVGASPIRVTYGPRTISLECAIIVDAKTGESQIESIKRDLGNKFSPVGMGYVPNTSLTSSNYSTVTGKLSYASDGVTYDRFIDCVPISCEFPNRTYSDGFQRFRIALFCPDPTWYDAEQESVMGAVPLGVIGGWASICWSPELNLFVAVGISGTYLIQTSPDGIVWTGVLAPEANLWYSVCWADTLGLFVATSTNGTNRVMTSPDGSNWTLRTAAQANSWYNVCWSHELGLLCAVSTDGTHRVMTSSDAITWSPQSAAVANQWYGVTWSKELSIFCAVSNNGSPTQCQTSPDGITWTARTTAENNAWFRVCWSPELSIFVACATTGVHRIQTSPDGINWTFRTAAEANQWYSVAWSPDLNLFVAVANSGTNKAMSSPDGVNWTARLMPVTSGGFSVCWSHEIGAFCAIAGSSGDYPSITYDGSSWFASSSSDYVQEITNEGDIPAEFEIDIPVIGGETSKKVVISDNFLWDGSGTPPSDHNLVFGTDGLKLGTVNVSTKFNNKDITQFGTSKFNLYQQGTFFSLYVSGATTNNIYVRNTGTAGGAPTIRWKNRYLGV
jgi:hypothetical protein